MEIRLLGTLEVRDGEQVIALPRRQQRALLAALALRAGEVVSTDRLIGDLWGERAPASASGSVQNTVSALRKLLGREVLLTQAPGYRLALDSDAVDAHRFEKLLADARTADAAASARILRDALALWRGPALADFEEAEFARLAATRLEELRVAAQEERIEAELELGHHAALVGELETLVALNPLRERLRGQLMLALYRCGRQAEALEVYRAARLALADELGLDPSPELQELERRVLRQDPDLAAPPEIQEAAAVAERRLVSVLVALPPTDEDPEALRRGLDELLAEVREVLARYGGALERFGPEGVVAVFGAGAPREDDASNAVRAANELGLPAGVATGEAVSGAGAVFVRAAALARAGGVRLDERTAALVRDERRLELPLVGRAEELGRLRAEFDAARTDRCCRVVTVLGEPGIGKTRLGRELAAALEPEARILVGRCFSYGGGAALLPLLEALREIDLQAALASEPEGDLAAQRLGALAAPDVSSIGEWYWAVRRLLEALARSRPVLLLLDDTHWAEPGLLDLVDYLGERVTEAPLLVVCLARPEVERVAGTPLVLGTLPDDALHELVANIADLDAETRARIVALAEGNALYAEQLASFAAEGGEGLPPTLEAVLAGRLGRVGDAERAVLQRAAVVGREFSRGAVAAISDRPVDAALAVLSRQAFIHPAALAERGDDGYRFHHALLRDAAYAGLTKADRADLHERAARWLDRDGAGDDALVGYHLEQAVACRRELGEDADALAETAGARLGAAGMRVWRMNDVAASVALLGRAVGLLPAGVVRAELHWERAIALRLHDRAEEADEALASAASDAAAVGSPRVAARVACERAHVDLLNGSLPLDRAAQAIGAALPQLRDGNDLRGLGRAELALCAVHWFACRCEELGAAAERAERHYTAARFSPAACIGIQAEVLFYGAVPVPSALDRCAALLERSPDRPTHAAVTAVLGGLHSLAGGFAEGRKLLAQARELYEESGNQLGLLNVWTPLFVELEWLAGNAEEAERRARASLEGVRHAGVRAYASARALQLAELLLERGNTEDAAASVALAEQEALPSDVLVQFWWRSARARILARDGDLAEAAALGRDAVALASLTDGLRDRARAHLALAEVLALADDAGGAKRELSAARKLLRAKGATALLARLAPVPARG